MTERKRRCRRAAEPDAPAPLGPKHAVLLDRASLAVVEVAEDDRGRYIVDHVRVEQDGTAVGLSGKLLLAVEPPREDLSDLPVTLAPADVPLCGLHLSKETCKAVSTNLKKGGAFRPILACAVVTRCDDTLVEVSSTDLKRVKREGEVPAEGTFPKWKDMVERPWTDEENDEAGVGPVVQLGLKLDVLENLVKALKKVTADMSDDTPFVRFTFNANKGHVLIDGAVGGDRRFLGMTARMTKGSVNLALDDLNDWQNAILGAAPRQATKKEADDEQEA